MDLSRRDLLKLGVFGSAALVLPLERLSFAGDPDEMDEERLPRPFTAEFRTPPVLQPMAEQWAGKDPGKDYYSIDMVPMTASILPGVGTPMFAYRGHNGAPSVPGPTIYARRGRPVVMRQCNQLPATHPQWGYKPITSVHLHGSASLPQFDGYASDITNPNEWKDYEYPNIQDARTLWYHDHGVHHTAMNAYMGLAGMYVLHDDAEYALPIPKYNPELPGGGPSGKYDVPIILTNPLFDEGGRLLWEDESQSGLHGHVNLVNGVPWPVMKVEQRKYRFRILNAAITRSYRLTLDTGDEMAIIGTDGGLMPKPVRVTSFRHAPAERYEVMIDFAKYPVGKRVVLGNLSNPNNRDYEHTDKVMAFDVVGPPTSKADNAIPSTLNTNTEVMGLTPAMSVATRTLDLIRTGSQWTINGKTWADVESSGFTHTVAKPQLGTVETWVLRNTSGGWFHPLHIHLVDFKVINRNGASPFPYEKGPKDVVYVGENETVRVLARFGPHPGKYMVHCHNLVHEDHDMMTQFEVVGPTPGSDPMGARAKPMPSPEPF